MTDAYSDSAAALESRARRAAKRVGLEAHKSRWRRDTTDNHGKFRLMDPRYNHLVAGERYEISPEDVIYYCDRLGKPA